MLWLLALQACQTTLGDPSHAPTEWDWTAPVQQEQPIDLGPVEEALSEYLHQFYIMDPTYWMDEWKILYDDTDDSCPQRSTLNYDFGSLYRWTTPGCTNEYGFHYEGYSDYNESIGEEEDGWSAHRQFIWADADVSSPSGWTFHGLGILDRVYRWRTSPDGALEHYLSRAVIGEMNWSHPQSPLYWRPDGPYHQGISKKYWTEGSGGKIAINDWVSGRLGWATGIFATEFTQRTSSWALCPANEPSGVLAVRDPHARWIVLQFHGPVDETTPPTGPCDGCADVTVDGKNYGTLCVDFEQLVADMEP